MPLQRRPSPSRCVVSIYWSSLLPYATSFDDSHASRSGKDELVAALSLADRLRPTRAEQLLLNVDTLLSTDTTADVSSYSAYNNPHDKIIMLAMKDIDSFTKAKYIAYPIAGKV